MFWCVYYLLVYYSEDAALAESRLFFCVHLVVLFVTFDPVDICHTGTLLYFVSVRQFVTLAFGDRFASRVAPLYRHLHGLLSIQLRVLQD